MTVLARRITPGDTTGVGVSMAAVQGGVTAGRTCVVIDDHETLRVGAAAVLAAAGISVVAGVDCAPCVVDLDIDEPDLLIVDLQYGGARAACRAVQGAEAVALIAARWPQAPILVYTHSSCDRCAVAAMAAGSCGHLRKAEGNRALLQAAEAVLEGGTYVPAWLARLIERAEHELGHPFGLTDRQLEVLRHVAQGRPQQLIARHLGVSVDTVKEHLATARARMQAATTIDAVRKCAQAGLLAGFTPPSALACACWADGTGTRPG